MYAAMAFSFALWLLDWIEYRRGAGIEDDLGQQGELGLWIPAGLLCLAVLVRFFYKSCCDGCGSGRRYE